MVDIQFDTDAVSPVIGVILVIAVTVVLSTIIGVFVLDLSESQSNTESDNIGVSISENQGEITATVITGSADKVTLQVNGFNVDSLTNPEVGDSLSVSGVSSGSELSIITTNNGQDTVSTSRMISDGSPNPTSFNSPTGCNAYSWGDDDSDGKLDVSNIEDLQCINANSTTRGNDYELVNDVNAGGTVAWNNGSGFEPIGPDSVTEFTGTFDGDNYTITGLHINRPSTSQLGLFGAITSSTVKNVRLTDVYVNGDQDIGGVIGYNDGAVKNTYSDGTITSSGGATGGLVGYNYGTIKNSHTSGTVESTDAYVGGLVGQNQQTVSSSHSNAVVSGTSEVGGLIGIHFGTTVKDSYATGAVSGEGYVGGLVGDDGGGVTNSYATGRVNGTRNHIGGLTGLSSEAINQSYATGEVNASTISARVGGLVGKNTGLVKQSFATGNVNAAGASNVGGLVGVNEKVTQSYANGSVTGANRVGGLVGDNNNIVNKSYASGSVNKTDIIGDVGGVLGNNGGTVEKTYWMDTDSTDDASGEVNNNDISGIKNASDTNTSDYSLSDLQGTSAKTNMGSSGDGYFDFTTIWKTITDDYPRLRK